VEANAEQATDSLVADGPSEHDGDSPDLLLET
jgi:hypothetical protein